jgi:hypothetical protein
VHVAVVLDGGDFNPRHDPHAELRSRFDCLPDAAHRIVIGDRDRRQTRRGGALHEQAGPKETVRRCGVKVEINHGTDRAITVTYQCPCARTARAARQRSGA